ncbi:MAG: hypothetical protein UH734_02365 [Ruminococcus sp.]|nr:hypothetical protein [Ruminococcus sp.]
MKKMRELGVREISLGVESGDDRTLDRINKGYHASDIIEQCKKLHEAGIDFWMTFLNGTAGREHSRDHAINSAIIFSQCKPMLVGTGGLTLFPGTPLLEEAQRGEFTPLSATENRRCNTKNTIRRMPNQSADIRRLIWHVFFGNQKYIHLLYLREVHFYRRFHIRSSLPLTLWANIMIRFKVCLSCLWYSFCNNRE